MYIIFCLYFLLWAILCQYQKFIANTQGTMGIIRSCFSFIAGTVCGVYVAQNYQVPNIMKLADTALFMAKVIEEKYRKPKKRGDDDD
ncbi:hypothetical protein VNO77_29470 [Canavalia gladiata]|uniref:Uncharacterized protein n=1 Tax=Canavalia gladiata TaxID=3824 RepID=A0AAN9Q5D0_CANGL